MNLGVRKCPSCKSKSISVIGLLDPLGDSRVSCTKCGENYCLSSIAKWIGILVPVLTVYFAIAISSHTSVVSAIVYALFIVLIVYSVIVLYLPFSASPFRR